MKIVVLLDKRTYLLRVLTLFKEKQEVSIKELKQKIPSASYYRFLLPKILDVNQSLKEIGIDYFIEPVFLRNGSEILTGLRINHMVKVRMLDSFIRLSVGEDDEL